MAMHVLLLLQNPLPLDKDTGSVSIAARRLARTKYDPAATALKCEITCTTSRRSTWTDLSQSYELQLQPDRSPVSLLLLPSPEGGATLAHVPCNEDQQQQQQQQKVIRLLNGIGNTPLPCLVAVNDLGEPCNYCNLTAAPAEVVSAFARVRFNTVSQGKVG